MKLLRSTRVTLMTFALLLPACGLAADANPGATDWITNFEALKAGLARNYANFEYTLTDRRIDLPAIAARHREALEAATTYCTTSSAQARGDRRRHHRQRRRHRLGGSGCENAGRIPALGEDRDAEASGLGGVPR